MRTITSSRDNVLVNVQDDASEDEIREAFVEKRARIAAASRYSPTEGMGYFERARANLGAGFARAGRGAAQLAGRGPTPERYAMHEQAAGELRERDPYFAAGAQFGGEVLPFAPVVAAGVPAAALAGVTQGALSEADPSGSVAGQKLVSAGAGGLAGAALAKGAPYVARALPKALRAAQGFTEAGRTRAAEQAFAEAMPSGAAQRLREFQPEVPGVQTTPGQILRDPGALGIEAQLLRAPGKYGEAGEQAGARLRAGRRATDQALWEAASPALEAEGGQAAREAADALWRSQRGALKPVASAKGEFFEGVPAVVGEIGELEQRSIVPSVQKELEQLRTQLSRAHMNAQTNPALGLEQLHQIRRTSINDALSRLQQSDSGAAKLLRGELETLKTSLDQALDQGLEGSGAFSGLMSEYSGAAGRAGQIEQGEALLEKMRSGKGLSTGEASFAASSGDLRAIAEQSKRQTDRYGKPVYLPEGQKFIESARDVIEREGATSAADIQPLGSATAQNILGQEGRRGGAQILGAAQSGAQAALEPASSLRRAVTLDWWMKGGPMPVWSARRAQDTATKLLNLYTDPKAAIAALENLPIKPEFREGIAQEIAARARPFVVEALDQD